MHNIESFSAARSVEPSNETDDGSKVENLERLRRALKTVPPLYSFLRTTRRVVDALAEVSAEIPFVVTAYKHLRTFDLLVVSGGGQLCEYWGGAWAHPYTLFKWALIAKAARVRFIFVSVGAGPLDSRLTKFFTRRSLMAADYVSLRDERSKALVESIGVRKNMSVYPDLAFSLSLNRTDFKHKTHPGEPLVVGISPITYLKPDVWARSDESVYKGYVTKLAEMILWLVDKNFRVLLFQSQTRMDVRAIKDLKSILRDMGHPDLDDRIMEPHIGSVGDLLHAISRTDMVIASRFHSVLLSAFLYKPVIAISFDIKVDSLMENLQLAEFLLDIHDFDLSSLVSRFQSLERRRNVLSDHLTTTVPVYRSALESQYSQVFDTYLYS